MVGAEVRTYDRQQCVSFRKTDGTFGGLSNMAPGFPLKVNGVLIRTSEALYQACRFPHLPKVQRLIIDEGSPMTAKMKSKPYRSQSRPDWDGVRVKIMRWCLRVKLAQHWDKFSRLLLATGNQPIVEDSRKDDFWGAKPQDDGTLVGGNVLGRLLMELREQLRDPGSSALRRIEPPTIPNFLLYERPIEAIDVRLGSDVAVSPRDSFSASTPPLLPPPAVASAPVSSGPKASPTSHMASTETKHVDSTPNWAAYPKRLIEVDLPIKVISDNARYENSLRHGRISNLHLWWARRPTVACRAVLLAASLPDPADPRCPERFRREASAALAALRAMRGGEPTDFTTPFGLRQALLGFVGDMSAWTIPLADEMWRVARTLVTLAHETLGEPGTRPLCADPFAGGGSIPIEALRLGMDVVASDSNQVAVLLNRAALELLSKHGPELEEAVGEWGQWVLARARERLSRLYPVDPDGATPIAYLWARTIRCEGPGCGAEIPLLRSFCVAKKKSRSVYLKLIARSNPPRIDFELDASGRPETGPQGTIRSGSVTCPVPGCGFTTRLKAVREQIKSRQGATADARLICVATIHPRAEGRSYRLPTPRDLETVALASELLRQRLATSTMWGQSFVPDEPISTNELRRVAPPLYGMSCWGHLFSARQSLALGTFCELIHHARDECAKQRGAEFADSVQVFLALTLSRLVDLSSSLTRWKADAECPVQLISRQAIPFVWDFAEPSLIAASSGSWASAVERTTHVLRSIHLSSPGTATVVHAPAQEHPLPTASVNALITDPPYYDSVPYAHLSDFFYVWLKRAVPASYRGVFAGAATDKGPEIVVDRPHSLSTSRKDVDYYEKSLRRAFEEGLRILATGGIGVVVFASKSTASWEAILRALIEAGWVISGSWPIDTEMETRVSAQGQARLGSSIHLVCRPRTEHGSSSTDQGAIGDWREVLAELPIKMHDWFPRLEREGIAGADAIFSCLGPALEIFSRYSRVEKVSGERVELREYLEHVWAAVSREALATVFRDADTLGLEEDARLSAMWLWTLAGHSKSSSPAVAAAEDGGDEDLPSDDIDSEVIDASAPGFTLEYDAARKIAQGVGARLDALTHLVEVKADKARLLPVVERTGHLFGKTEPPPLARKAVKRRQMALFAELEDAASAQGWGDGGTPRAGTTTLDRVHQAMLLFGAGRSEALKRFILEDGVGRQPEFWKLAQSLSALYPSGTDEKRWIDGVLARKKGLGF